MTLLRNLFLATLLLGTPVILMACEEQTPLEEAGENISDTMEDAGDSIEEGMEEVSDEFDDATTN